MFISKICKVLKCSAVIGLLLAFNTAFSAEQFRPHTFEMVEIEVLKMPTNLTNGRILVYLPDSSGNICASKSCAKRYDLDKDFRTEVDGEYSLMEQNFFKSLPRQKVYLHIYEKGVVKVVGFVDIIIPEVMISPVEAN